MKAIKLGRTRAEALMTDAGDGRAEEWLRQSAAIAWIIAAGLIGILVSQVSVLGAEPASTDCLARRLQNQETEFALVYGGLDGLERIYQFGNDRHNDPQLEQRSRATMLATAIEDHQVEPIPVIVNEDLTIVAKHEVRRDSEPQIALVAHGDSSLTTPVHDRPVAGSTASDPSRTSVVSYVETNTLFDEPDDLVNTTVQSMTPEAAIVRSHPQVREVSAPPILISDRSLSSNRRAPQEKAIAVSNGTRRRRLSSRSQAPVATAEQFSTTQPTANQWAGNFPTVTAQRTPKPAAMRLVKPANSAPTERVATSWPFKKLKIETNESGVKLNVDNADVRSVFEMLARGYSLNILVAPDVQGTVTANVDGLSPEQTLRGVVKMAGLSMQVDENLIFIYSSEKLPLDARQLRVFSLDFARAASLESTVQGLLSPVGNAYSSTINDQDTMQTQESIVVVDIPEVIAQVENFILQTDRAPRQVLIEARILEVELSDEMIHGVDFDYLLSRDVTLSVNGLAAPVVTVANPRSIVNISGTDLAGVLECLETTTDSKTLASPRVQVVNGQNARIQVGGQLGFTVATVTQTSTIQDVQFLETGVVLNVTPTISRDNRILLDVKPEVSEGEINPTTLLPEEQTREVETSVLLDNHQGVIIGGLIQEEDRTVVKKLPWLGDIRYVGKLFQRREATRSRSEIIVALIPHIIEPSIPDERSMIDYDRVDTPLFHGTLQRTCRPWEPRMPDYAGEEFHLDVNKINRRLP